MTKQVRRLMFSKDAYTEMFRMRAKGDTFRKIAERFGCSDVFIGEVIKGQTRQEETAHVPPKLREKAVNFTAQGQGGGRKANGSQEAAFRKQQKLWQEEKMMDFTALADLVEARRACKSAQKRCLDSGFSQAYIDLTLEEAFKGSE